ncbi:MAG TPA: hypothetical protein VK891_00015 [Euzebyales bacterium]|nr:hypothetical protein [Euzebyales bacterium]
MTTIRATCPTCGEVGLTPDEMELHVDPSGARQAMYNFDCPGCLTVVTKPADERIVRLLASGGVPVLEWAPPPPRPAGPPLSFDDLLDFHALLQTDTWFDDLVDLLRFERGHR